MTVDEVKHLVIGCVVGYDGKWWYVSAEWNGASIEISRLRYDGTERCKAITNLSGLSRPKPQQQYTSPTIGLTVDEVKNLKVGDTVHWDSGVPGGYIGTVHAAWDGYGFVLIVPGYGNLIFSKNDLHRLHLPQTSTLTTTKAGSTNTKLDEQPHCTCGTAAIYPNADHTIHSDWCDLRGKA